MVRCDQCGAGVPDDLMLTHAAEHGVGSLAALEEELESATLIDVTADDDELSEEAAEAEWRRLFPGEPFRPVSGEWRRAAS